MQEDGESAKKKENEDLMREAQMVDPRMALSGGPNLANPADYGAGPGANYYGMAGAGMGPAGMRSGYDPMLGSMF